MSFSLKREKNQFQKILINGAGGGAGSFAIQIAKAYGAEVTGIDSREKLDLMRSIDTDEVIDYTQEDFTKKNKLYDLILDVVTFHSIFKYKQLLEPKGSYFMFGGEDWNRVFQSMFLSPFVSIVGGKKMKFLIHKPNIGMSSMIELFKSGKVKPVIDKSYSLEQLPDAFRYYEKGHVKGKIIITMEHDK